MERLTEMITFARVVETKSFSAAALALSTSKSLVSKQVGALESALGVRLLNRTTRSMSLTDVGAAYYEHCARIMQEIQAAADTVSQLQAEPRGMLKITSPVIFASMHLAPAVQSFLVRHEHVGIEVNASDRVLDLIDEGYDLAIRISENPSPTMIARRIAPVHWVTCASPEYLERHGTPRTPRDLLKHQCLQYFGTSEVHLSWRYEVGNKEVVVPISGRCRANSSEVLLQLALNGMGIVLYPTYILGRYLKTGRLRPILTDAIAFPGMSLYAMYWPNRYMQPKVRAFIDHLMEHFGPTPDWDKY